MTEKQRKYQEVEKNLSIAQVKIINAMHDLVQLEDDVTMKDEDFRMIRSNLKFCLKIWAKAHARFIECYMRANGEGNGNPNPDDYCNLRRSPWES